MREEVDIVFLELFEEFMGLKSDLSEDFRPNKSSKRCYFRSLKLTYFDDLLCCHLCLLLTALHIKFKCLPSSAPASVNIDQVSSQEVEDDLNSLTTSIFLKM